MSDNCKTVNINGSEYIRSDLVPDEPEGDYVIVRCSGAGVHAGYLAAKSATEVTLTRSLRLWRWHGRTLNGLAVDGPDDPGKCKFGPEQPKVDLSGWHEIEYCTERARIALQAVREWQNA